jgi:hypothetical protein
MRKALLTFMIFPLFLFAQTTAENHLASLKDSLNGIAKKMQRGENDSVRNNAAQIFQTLMENILKDSTSFTASFDSIKIISAKTAPDNTFRLYTWTYPNNDGGRYFCYGYLQTNFKEFKRFKGLDTKTITLFKLTDSTDAIEKPKSTKLKPDNWYGAVYYSIVKNVIDKKNYYTLLGWRGRNTQVSRKVADVLYFDGGRPNFGYPLFKTGKVYNHRVIFEYVAQASMTLNYDENRKMLVFDHLSKVGPFFGPDGTYDAFKYSKSGRWELVEDVDVNAGFKPKASPRINPDGQLKEKK